MENSQIIFWIIISFIILEFIFDKTLSFINSKSWEQPLPDNVKDLYDAEKYEKAKNYARENGKIGLISSLLSFVAILVFLFANGFAWIDSIAKNITENHVLQALIFFGILSLASTIISLPFGIYKTFVIEEKYGFNKTTTKTFVLDFIKGLFLSAIIGGSILALLTCVFYLTPNNFWWIAWIVVSGFSIFFAMFYTSWIVPIFNKLTPLEEGKLRTSIENYAQKVNFPLTNISIIDGSKRSTKANAYFSGLGKKKSIVLYDTLMKDNTEEEITAILAHEVGHYKKKHITKSIFISLFQTGVLFALFGWISGNPDLAMALGVEEPSFHIALIAFSLLYAPVSLITGILMNIYSRKNEFEADNFAKTTYDGAPLASALKKLAVNHLSNLTPHKSYVFVHYSHPPLSERLSKLEK
jgi:STE24 endopeptidase